MWSSCGNNRLKNLRKSHKKNSIEFVKMERGNLLIFYSDNIIFYFNKAKKNSIKNHQFNKKSKCLMLKYFKLNTISIIMKC